MSAVVDDPTQGPSAPAVAVPIGHERVFEAAPEEELLYSLSADGKRKFMHPTVHTGRFWQIRRVLAYALFVLFVALPIIPVGGYPAVFFDIANRKSHIFGGTFYPTDALILVSFGLSIVVTVFFVASTFGRMWCGYACPQTVYLEFLFRPIEAWLEGGPLNQKRLNAGPWTAQKYRIKATKWVIWTAVALFMSLNFAAYFNGWVGIRALLAHPGASKGVLFLVALLTVAILFDFSWFRDQMCTIACPYGRLQNVLSDKDTILVAYDVKRGDPKVKLRDRVAGRQAGDCINCFACVSACPTGTDIRRGLQPECIGTAQCVDACEEVMLKQGKPIGLIKYTSERQQQGETQHTWRLRNIAYLTIMTLTWGTFGTLVLTRANALVEFVRGGREPYRLLQNGLVANQQRVRFTNQLETAQKFTVELVGQPKATFVLSDSPVTVGKTEVVTVNAVTTVPPEIFVDGQATVTYVVTSDQGYRKEIKFLLLGPFNQVGAGK